MPFVLESFKADNWIFFGIPMAQLIASATVLGASAILVMRRARRPSRIGAEPIATLGQPAPD